jgi:hypothetical protein
MLKEASSLMIVMPAKQQETARSTNGRKKWAILIVARFSGRCVVFEV